MKKRHSECNGKAEGLDAGLDPAIGPAESLPEAWIVVPFVRSIDDKRVQIIKVQQAKYKNAGRFPIIDQGQKLIAGYWDDEGDVYRGRLPVIVFGDHTRAFKFVDFPFVAGADGTQVLAPCADRFDPYFLYLTLSSLDIPSRGYNRHFRFLKERSVVAPPLPEQRAIAAVLRTVQRAKEACEKVIAATRALKQTLLHHLFTYGPVPFDQADRVELKETEIGLMPEHWYVSRLGDHAIIGNGSTPKRREPRFWEGGTIPWLTSGKVHDSTITYADEFVTPTARKECHLPLVPRGSIVIAITGQGKTLGNSAILEIDACVSQHLAYVFFRSAEIVPAFTLAFLRSRYEQLQSISRAGGSTKGALTCGFLKGFEVPLPPPPEQRAISSPLRRRRQAGRRREAPRGARQPFSIAPARPDGRPRAGEPFD